MRFIADENVDRQIVDSLRTRGHLVDYVAELEPGIGDDEVLERALGAQVVLITSDKDFGEIVFRQRRLTAGVFLLRLSGLDSSAKVMRVLEVVEEHGVELPGTFSVVTPRNLRIRRVS